MCLIAFAFKSHPEYDLIVAANRDEFYARPTETAHFWPDFPEILGGRDLKAQGTWMGVSTSGRFAAVTNYRDLKSIREDAKSRGNLPVDFLLDQVDLNAYFAGVQTEAPEYNGFNLIAYENGNMLHFSNYEGTVNHLKPGIYGLSNALLDTPWPKLKRIKNRFTKAIQGEFSHQDLLALLSDGQTAPDDELPDTGVGYEFEKMLSAICIRSENYGTCCSTVLTVSKSGQIEFTEQSLPVGDRKAGSVHEIFST